MGTNATPPNDEEGPAVRRMKLELTFVVPDPNAGGAGKQMQVAVYVLDAQKNAHLDPGWLRRPITIAVSPIVADTGDGWETLIDLTPFEAAGLRDFLDLLLRSRAWLGEPDVA